MKPTKINPYQLGYEDGMRSLKKNPYLQGSIQWMRYWNGQEAARQVRKERLANVEQTAQVEAVR